MDKAEPLTRTHNRMTRRASEPGLSGSALELAHECHTGQARKDGTPYIEHPQEVADTLEGAGYDEEVLAAALLHDVVERTDVDVAQIEERFGARVAALVAALTEDASIPGYDERKRAQRPMVEEAGPDAVAIYAADKLANVRDVGRAYSLEGEEVGRKYPTGLDARIQLWHEDLEMVAAAKPSPGFVRNLRYELESLEELRASRPERP